MLRRNIIILILFVIVLAVYLSTLCPAVYIGDSGELTVAGFRLGIPHPPGYPLYCLLAHIFILLPAGTIAFRANLMSAFFGVLTVIFLFLVLEKMLSKAFPENSSRMLMAAVLAPLFLAFSGIFWSESVVAEVFTLLAFFFAAILYLILCWIESGQTMYLYAGIFLSGLGLGNHISLVLFFPAFLYLILAHDFKVVLDMKKVFMFVILGLAGFLVYLYLPVRARANPVLNWGNPDTLERFINVITRRQYGSLQLAPGQSGATFKSGILRVFELVKNLSEQFSFAGIIAGLAGIIVIFRKNRKLFWFLLITLFFSGPFFVFISRMHLDPSSMDVLKRFYVLPALVLVICSGWCLVWLLHIVKTQLFVRIIFPVFLILPFIMAGLNWQKSDRSKNHVALDYGTCLLKSVDPGGVLFAAGDQEVFILAYLKMAEMARPDVRIYDELAYVFPNIYGNDFRQLSTADKITRVYLVQKGIAANSAVPVFCTVSSDLWTKDEMKYAPSGLTYRIIRKAPEIPQQKADWQYRYKIRGVDDDRIYKEHFLRNLCAHYYYFQGEEAAFGNDRESAKKLYLQASRAGESVEEVRLTVGVGFTRHGFTAEAEKEFNRALEINPNSVQSLFDLGNLSENNGKTQQAIEYYRKALDIAPLYNSTRLNLGDLYEKTGRINEALDIYSEAIKQEPAFYEAYYNLGNIYLARNQFKTAEQYYIDCLKINPLYLSARHNLAIAYRNQGLMEKAIDEYAEIVRLNPDNAEAHFNMGVFYANNREIQKAVLEWKKALAIDHDYGPAKESLIKAGKN